MIDMVILIVVMIAFSPWSSATPSPAPSLPNIYHMTIMNGNIDSNHDLYCNVDSNCDLYCINILLLIDIVMAIIILIVIMMRSASLE